MWPVFFGFRAMVGLGLVMLAAVVTGWMLRLRGRLFETGWFLGFCPWLGPIGFVAVIAGWITTEVGRQPWTVYGVFRTADSLSPSLTGGNVLGSLLLYAAVYLIMFPAGIAFMAGIVRDGVRDAPARPNRSRVATVPNAQSRGGVTGMAFDRVVIWTGIIGGSVFLYVLLDGFDLGAGILYGFAPEADKDKIMNTIVPIWDGNETWLILGGLGLLAVFPLAFAIVIPAVYFPILTMLLGLIFRGVAFEFRFKQPRIRQFWTGGFCAGSAVATFSQGIVLGAFIQGFRVSGRDFAGTSWDWLTPFSMLTGVALMFGYALLGSGWLILKTEGDLQEWARRMGRICFMGVLAAVAVVSVWTPLMDPEIARRWFSWPNIAFLAPVPLVTLGLAIVTWRALNRDDDAGPFLGAFGLFLMSYLGITISLWPFVVPRHFTLWQAASSPSTQMFLLVGTAILLPIIIAYTGWSYWVFRGKLRDDVHYH